MAASPEVPVCRKILHEMWTLVMLTVSSVVGLSAWALQSSLGELMGSDGELPADAKENLAAILETVATIIDSDSSGTITEAEFVASAKVGASPERRRLTCMSMQHLGDGSRTRWLACVEPTLPVHPGPSPSCSSS
jgi:hypothetical protein